MKRLSIARKFYPRLRYIRINISKLLAALLQVGMLQSSLVQSTGLPIVMAGLVGVAGTAHAEVISGLSVGMGGSYTVNWMDTASNTVTQGVLNVNSLGSRVRYQLNDKAQLLGYASVGYDALARASHLRASTEDHRFSVTSADPGNIVTRLGLAYEWRAKAGNYLRANYDYQGRDKGYRDNMLRLDWIVVW